MNESPYYTSPSLQTRTKFNRSFLKYITFTDILLTKMSVKAVYAHKTNCSILFLFAGNMYCSMYGLSFM